MPDPTPESAAAPSPPRLLATDLRPGPLTVDRLELWPGEIAGLSGPSGSGKTLLLRCLADLDPHAGELRLDGRDSLEMPATQWRRRVGFVAAESAWWSDRVGDHFPAWPSDAASSLGFGEDVAGWSIQRMSTGEKQRLALLRAICLSPRVLLLDEPTSGLDEDNARRVEKLVAGRARSEDLAVLWVGHDARQLERICRRLWEIDAGRLLARSRT